MKIYPTREYLLECFDYKKETGELFWKKRPYSHFENKAVWRQWNSSNSGKEIGRRVRINNREYAKSKIILKITHDISIGTRDRAIVNGHIHYRNGRFEAVFTFERKKICKLFKIKLDAEKWLDETKKSRLRKELVHKTMVNKSGFYGVYNSTGSNKFCAQIVHEKINFHLGVFDTAKQASEAYQKAKEEIKDGSFIPPEKRISKTGFVGVRKKGGRFESAYKSKYLGLFPTAELAHEAYLKAKNPPKTFDDGLDILRKLANEYA